MPKAKTVPIGRTLLMSLVIVVAFVIYLVKGDDIARFVQGVAFEIVGAVVIIGALVLFEKSRK